MSKKLITSPQHRFGWQPFKDRSKLTHQMYEEFCASLPEFKIGNRTVSGNGKSMLLYEFSRKIYGKHLLTSRQLIGSCVGHGKYNAERTLMCVDIALRGEFEKYTEIFEAYGYGRSRTRAGISGSGSGSTGAGAAEAAMKDGVLRRDLDGLSGWSESDSTITWSEACDTKWSNGAKIEQKWIDIARKNLVKTCSLVTSYEQVRDAILNGYPVTVASNRGFTMSPQVYKGRAYGKASGSWAHQMCFIGVDDSGDRPGCYIWNSWGAEAHGAPPNDIDPWGGFWVDASVVNSMVSQQDSFAYSQFDGFPEQKLDKALFKIGNR